MLNASKTLLIVYHSMTGATLQVATAAAQGARSESAVVVRLMRAADAGADEVLLADGYIFATPENLAAMSGLMKDFFDRTYYPAQDRLNGRPYATLVCAGNDGGNAAQQIARIALGWRLKAIAEPLIVCTHATTPEQILAPKQLSAAQLAPCQELGKTLACGLAVGIF
jgi:multimeric flavodoxin WrbA